MGALETTTADQKRLSDVLGSAHVDDELENKRKSSGSTHLSSVARRNLYSHYNKTDYQALRVLRDLGFLPPALYELDPPTGVPRRRKLLKQQRSLDRHRRRASSVASSKAIGDR